VPYRNSKLTRLLKVCENEWKNEEKGTG
jgi:hypothetical protein